MKNHKYAIFSLAFLFIIGGVIFFNYVHTGNSGTIKKGDKITNIESTTSTTKPVNIQNSQSSAKTTTRKS
jgi:hypothetical protein